MRFLYLLMCLILLTSTSLVFAAQGGKTAKTKCIKNGGIWGSWSKFEASKNIESCRFNAKDANKSCLDGKECSTRLCEYEPKSKSGRCTEYKGSNGCHIWMENGKAQPEICKD
jgi:hypothetical protein